MMHSLSQGDIDQIRFLDCLEGSEIAFVHRLLKAHSFTEGQAIFSEGEPGDRLFFILSGVVRIEKSAQGGKGRTITILERRAMFGDMALLDGSFRSATAIAESDVLLASLHRDQFDELMDERPRTALKLMKALMRVMSQRLRLSAAELVDAWAYTDE